MSFKATKRSILKVNYKSHITKNKSHPTKKKDFYDSHISEVKHKKLSH